MPLGARGRSCRSNGAWPLSSWAGARFPVPWMPPGGPGAAAVAGSRHGQPRAAEKMACERPDGAVDGAIDGAIDGDGDGDDDAGSNDDAAPGPPPSVVGTPTPPPAPVDPRAPWTPVPLRRGLRPAGRPARPPPRRAPPDPRRGSLS
ncbi:hypothetical protein CXG81DRAFT_23054 [Caulochytrium protostelioides]|uniref:Uncharacterized protein n=1 Tax=Caulochytrium protostelioides TaxID=1555241 RepID=A0A4P9XFE9_9FUNG|nr:hypothetical protein CXG81DRAFT_23054 [Caulochytrium protostelioides]|eukprot:RKP04278.1 hypothetical protein CXG81DRAFT_23054 [Caulochytrium protostelioides]